MARSEAWADDELCRLMDEHETYLQRFARHLLGDADLALNCVQSTFLRAYESLGRGVYLPLLLFLTVSVAHAQTGSSARMTDVQFQNIVCPEAHTCIISGNHFRANGKSTPILMATHDLGTSWSKAGPLPKSVASGLTFPAGGLSCPDPQRCYEVGGPLYYGAKQPKQTSILGTADGGKSWKLTTFLKVQSNIVLGPLACPTAAVCYLAGAVVPRVFTGGQPGTRAALLVTKDAGKSWTNVPIPAAGGLELRAITCTSVTSCKLAGATQGKSCFHSAAILATADGGKTWTRQLGDCAAAIDALACPTPRVCYAAGWYGTPAATGNQLVLRTADGGASWDDIFEGPLDSTYRQGSSYSFPFGNIACPDPQICFLAQDRYLLATTDGGATWQVKSPVRDAVLMGIACPTTQTCLAVGWIQSVQTGPGPVHSTALIVRTLDGGTTWTRL